MCMYAPSRHWFYTTDIEYRSRSIAREVPNLFAKSCRLASARTWCHALQGADPLGTLSCHVVDRRSSPSFKSSALHLRLESHDLFPHHQSAVLHICRRRTAQSDPEFHSFHLHHHARPRTEREIHQLPACLPAREEDSARLERTREAALQPVAQSSAAAIAPGRLCFIWKAAFAVEAEEGATSYPACSKSPPFKNSALLRSLASPPPPPPPPPFRKARPGPVSLAWPGLAWHASARRASTQRTGTRERPARSLPTWSRESSITHSGGLHTCN